MPLADKVTPNLVGVDIGCVMIVAKLGRYPLIHLIWSTSIEREISLGMNVRIREVAKDARLDGYKGYTTNSSLPDERIIEEYGHLFVIERAFRFCKTDLDIRPMYHRLINRIEAHVCICFVAYTIMLELERILKAAGSKITLERARFLAERIYQITYVNPYDKKRKSVLLHNNEMPEITELLGIISENC